VQCLLALLVAAVVAASIGCGGSGEKSAQPQPLLRPDLQRPLRKLAQERHSAAVALVQTEAGVWRGSSGYAEGKRRAAPANRFGIASTTKTFVATVVLELVGEGRLALQDTVERRLPGRLREGRRITVRQLLNHTSGLAPDVSFSLPSRNAQQPLLSRPGTTYLYSNMNYIVLGLIVEKVTGRPVEQVVRDRIFRPLRLENTSYGTAALRPPGEHLPAWLGIPEDPSTAVGGNGGIVSTLDDLATFFRALLGGGLLRAELLAEMRRTVETGSEPAGLGLFQFHLSCGSPWGHGGDEPTYSNQVLAAGDGSKIVVVAQNTLGWPAAEATAEEMYCA
jgi:D-alanyl-D-alanine carboxypeptidase